MMNHRTRFKPYESIVVLVYNSSGSKDINLDIYVQCVDVNIYSVGATDH